MKWQTAWSLVKDIVLTGAGLALIILQVFAKQPSDVLLVTGLALTIPSVASRCAPGAAVAAVHGRAWAAVFLVVILAAWGVAVAAAGWPR